MIVDVMGEEKDINENLLDNSNSSSVEKHKIFKEITTVVNELKDRKKTAYKEDEYNHLCKERSILLSEVVFNSCVTELNLLHMKKS